MKRLKCEYPKCESIGKHIDKNPASAILCIQHSDELDNLVESGDKKRLQLIKFLLKITNTRFENNI